MHYLYTVRSVSCNNEDKFFASPFKYYYPTQNIQKTPKFHALTAPGRPGAFVSSTNIKGSAYLT